VKKVAGFVLVMAALGVGVVVGLWSSGSAEAITPTDLKCYRAHSIEKKVEAGQVIYLSDPFDTKETVVRALQSYCTLTEVGIEIHAAGETVTPTDLTCYGIFDAPGQPRFKRPLIGVQDPFGSYEIELLRPHSLCESAIKGGHGGSLAGTNGGILDAFKFKCYSLRRLGGSFGSKDIDLHLVNQFFPEGKFSELRRPKVFCAQVIEKKDIATNDDIDYPVPLSAPDEQHISTIGTDRFAAGDPDIKCADDYGHSVWYSFTSGVSDAHSFATVGSTYDTVMAMFAVKGDSLVQIACDDDGALDGGASYLKTAVTAGTKYLIMVGARGDGPGGKLKLSVDQLVICSSGCGSGEGSSAGAGAVAGDPDPPTPLFMLCYTISADAPEEDVIYAEDQLNAHVIDLGRATMLCALAEEEDED
jgi:hypothetical protein